MATKQPSYSAMLPFWVVLLFSYSLHTLTTSAQTLDSFNPVGSGTVYSIGFDRENNLLVGGSFTSFGGKPRKNLVLMDPEGFIDPTLSLDAESSVEQLRTLPDGRIIVVGGFISIGGVQRSYIARLKPNGEVDESFNANANNRVRTAALQRNGSILVGGQFTSIGGRGRTGLARFEPDGTLDLLFNPTLGGTSSSPYLNYIAVQPDGKILIAGSFTSVGGQARTNFARLFSDGTVDWTFTPPINNVSCLALQPDGKIFVGGNFATAFHTNIARLNTDGTADPSFTCFANNPVSGMDLQTDGKLIVCGSFSLIRGVARPYLARLNSDGTVDTSFSAFMGNAVNTLSLQQDGRIVIGGNFTNAAGQLRRSIARYSNTTPASQGLEVTDSHVRWLRSETAPEVTWATIAGSADGTNWTSLGTPARIAGGWEITGSGFTSNTYVRAQGLIYGTHSTRIAEALSGPLTLLTSPTDKTVSAGSTATFQAEAIGTTPVTYQWYKGSHPVDGSNPTAIRPKLILTNVFGADAGNYFAVIANDSGSVTSAPAQLVVIDPVITQSPTNRAVIPGQTTVFTVQAIGTAPLTYHWRKEGNPLLSTTTNTLSIANAQVADVGYYDVVVSNTWGTATSQVARFSIQVAPDSLLADTANVFASVVQPDGKIIIGGAFSSVSGQSRFRIARLTATGTLESSYNAGFGDTVFTLALQPDGKLLAGGWPSGTSTRDSSFLRRFHSNGGLDSTFISSFNSETDFPGVYSMAVQRDGKILVGGGFRPTTSSANTNIVRLNADGTVDTSFKAFANDIVYTMATQPDGKVVVGGSFTNLCGKGRERIGRLNPDGTLDETFNPGMNNLPLCLVVQPDGKILVGGTFTNIAGQRVNDLARLNADGSLDQSFVGTASAAVRTLALQSDGKIVVGGSFGSLSGTNQASFGRLEANGAFDHSFRPTLSSFSTIYSITIQPDGKLLVGGSFSTPPPTERYGFARFSNTGPVSDNLTTTSNEIFWERSGPGPEFSKVIIEYPTTEDEWIEALGEHTASGWKVTATNLSSNPTVRATGYVAGGRYGASTWQIHSSTGPVSIIRQPQDVVTNWGDRALFTVDVAGTPALSYQWRKDGVPLSNSALFSGVTTPILSVTNVSSSSIGGYSVVVSNPSGSVTSQVAQLNVRDPFISTNPISIFTNAGSFARFTARAGGSGSWAGRWYHNDTLLQTLTNLSGSQQLTLLLSNVIKMHEGDYWLVVSNASGTATSEVVQLTVNDPFIRTHPTSQVVQAGQTVSLIVGVSGTTPIRYQWRKDGADIASATNPVLSITNVMPADAGSYVVAISNSFGTLTSSNALIAVNTALLDTFNPGVSSSASALAVQPDGKLLVGGTFSAIAGHNQTAIARLRVDGSFDVDFTPQVVGAVNAILIGADSKITIGGQFTNVNGMLRRALARFDSNGVLDPAFTPDAFGNVTALAWQPDGKILVGGTFTNIAGQTRSRIARLHADGAVDSAFNAGCDNAPLCFAIQPDGKILVGGHFGVVNGAAYNYVVRLHADGTTDNTFRANLPGSVSALVLRPDGKILIGGVFTFPSPQPRSNVALLLPDGAFDPEFPARASAYVNALALQADGKIVLGGGFSTVNGEERRGLARLLPDGAIDQNFIPNVAVGGPYYVNAVALDGSGNLLVGGLFTNVAGLPRNNLARLQTAEHSVDLLSATPFACHWKRVGSLPEISSPVFEYSTNSLDWTSLPVPQRVSDGWMVTSTIPIYSAVRARAIVPNRGRSAWFVEHIATIQPPETPSILIDENFGFRSGAFGFKVAWTGEVMTVESSANLVNWNPVATNAFTNGTSYFSDPQSADEGEGPRFYRVRVP